MTQPRHTYNFIPVEVQAFVGGMGPRDLATIQFSEDVADQVEKGYRLFQLVPVIEDGSTTHFVAIFERVHAD